MSPLLSLRGVSRRFGGLVALHNISLSIEPGTCHALIGPNGAGKSTLVNIVAGALRPSSGRIIFNGRDVTSRPATERARLGIARTFQHPAVFGRLPVADNLRLAAGRANGAAPVAQVTDLADEAGLGEHIGTPAAALPYGLQRQLELAMALAGRPRLLLLDEPSAGLDPDEIAGLIRQIRDLARDTAVLLIDHNLDLVWTLADTVTVLDHGQRLITGSCEQVRASPAVHDAYLPTGDQPQVRASAQGRSPGPVLLRVRDLTAGYRGAPVLRGINLDVRQGETVAVLGRNGAGKTTMLSAIAGLIPARTPSTVEWNGRPLPVRPPQAPARAGVAIVPQGRRLFGSLTVMEHLVAAQATGAAGSTNDRPMWTPERIFALLPALSVRAKHKVHNLSGGEQQMLCLARALITNPRLLILDEASEGLAPGIIGQLGATLSVLAEHGIAILLAEQNLALATAIADRIIVLDRGRLALSFAAADLAIPASRERLQARLGVESAEPIGSRR